MCEGISTLFCHDTISSVERDYFNHFSQSEKHSQLYLMASNVLGSQLHNEFHWEVQLSLNRSRETEKHENISTYSKQCFNFTNKMV